MIVFLFVVLLGMGFVVASAQTATFKDVDSSFWGYEAIQWGIEQNIISGYNDGTFRPNENVTEEEFITILVRAFGVATVHKEN